MLMSRITVSYSHIHSVLHFKLLVIRHLRLVAHMICAVHTEALSLCHSHLIRIPSVVNCGRVCCCLWPLILCTLLVWICALIEWLSLFLKVLISHRVWYCSKLRSLCCLFYRGRNLSWFICLLAFIPAHYVGWDWWLHLTFLICVNYFLFDFIIILVFRP